MASGTALLDRFPALSRRIDHLKLMDGPTRIERATGLERALGIGELWIKHDDQTSALYGGNKVRKLEFLLAAARAAGHRRVVTVGAIGSHHVLATAIHGARHGFQVDAVLSPQPVSEHVAEQLQLILHSARRCVLVDRYEARPGVLAQVCRPESGEDRPAFMIPAGGSIPVGALGYVSAILELEDQLLAGAAPAPGRIYTALGSCGTLAGMAVGLGLSRLPSRVHGVRVCELSMAARSHVMHLARATAGLLRRSAPGLNGRSRRWSHGSPPFHIDHRFFPPGYGVPTPAVEEAVALGAEGGLVLDGTYSGRAFAALVADACAGQLRRRRVMFWHTLSSSDLTGRLAEARRQPPPPAFAPFLE